MVVVVRNFISESLQTVWLDSFTFPPIIVISLSSPTLRIGFFIGVVSTENANGNNYFYTHVTTLP